MNNYYIHYLFESEQPAAKDIKRIKDIITKSAGDNEKTRKLAMNMANKIKDVGKMERRYNAAVQLLGDKHPVTREFEQGLISLGGTVENQASMDQSMPVQPEDDEDNFQVDVQAPESTLPEEPESSQDDNFYTELEDTDEYEKLNNYLEELYNIDIDSIEDIKEVLKKLEILNNYRDYNTFSKVQTLFNDFFTNINTSQLINSIIPKSNWEVNSIVCMPADLENIHKYPFKWHIYLPNNNYIKNYSDKLPKGEGKSISYVDLNLPESGWKQKESQGGYSVDPLRDYKEGLTYSLVLRNNYINEKELTATSKLSRIPAIFFQVEINDSDLNKKLKFEFILNPLNFGFITLRSTYSSSKIFSAENFLYTIADKSSYLGTDVNGIKIYKDDINNHFKVQTKDLYLKYLIPLKAGICKYFKNNDYRKILKLFEYIDSGKVISNEIFERCTYKIYDILKRKFPDFPNYVPVKGYPGWRIRTDKTNTKYLAITPYVYYTERLPKRYLSSSTLYQRGHRGGYSVQGLNPAYKEIHDFGLNQTMANKELLKRIKNSIKLKNFKTCIQGDNYVCIPWSIFE